MPLFTPIPEANATRRLLSFGLAICWNASIIGVLSIVRTPESHVPIPERKATILAPARQMVKLAPSPIRLNLKSIPSPARSPIPLPLQVRAPVLAPAPELAASQPLMLPSAIPPVTSSAVTPPAPPSQPVRVAETGLFAAVTGREEIRAAVRSVQSSGFGGIAASQPRSQRSAQVGSSGFDITAGQEQPAMKRATSQTAFEAQQIASSRPLRSPDGIQKASFRPVEILSKPKPEYTEVARERRIEGEVWLEVLFGANGTPEIRRVVRSLGYGLDENAIQAASHIRFRPALRGELPVDEVATLRVQFLLAQ